MSNANFEEEEVDYYAILDVVKTATSSEIKKAYRKQALRWHPDKNPDNKEEADKQFKLVAEAYEVLSDKEKRHTYDKYGKSGLTSGGGSSSYGGADFGPGFHPHFFHFRDPMDIFAEFFGGADPFGDVFGLLPPFGRHRARPSRTHHSSHHQQHAGVFPGFGLFGNFGNSGFGGLGGFGGFGAFRDDDFFSSGFGGGGHTSSISFSTSNGFGGMPGMGGTNFRSSSTSTKIVNGKRVTTRKVIENGTETITVEEDGRITSHQVNGMEQAKRLEYDSNHKGGQPKGERSKHSGPRSRARK